MRDLAAAEAEIIRLIAEVAVRTRSYGFPSVPQEFRNGCKAAFDSGYETGWRNQQYRNPYTSRRHENAYYAGYRKGEAESLEEIGRMVQERKK